MDIENLQFTLLPQFDHFSNSFIMGLPLLHHLFNHGNFAGLGGVDEIGIVVDYQPGYTNTERSIKKSSEYLGGLDLTLFKSFMVNSS